MSEIVVSKFGGTSVADFDAMNRSADIVLSDANVRLVVLSASAGITNLLVALAEGLEPDQLICQRRRRCQRRRFCQNSNVLQQ
ncbi:amino acid kinase family protein, partial [Escherichia sp. TWPC-MK]